MFFSRYNKIKVPILLTIAVVIVLAMLRLGIWQLDRAEQKRVILQQLQSKAVMPAVDIANLLGDLTSDKTAALRFRQVIAIGDYRAENSVYIDNQVIDGQVGYKVFTPFELRNSDSVLLVNRGWLPVGDSRDTLPDFSTPQGQIEIAGRLNLPPQQPPLWDEQYSVSDGKVWQYLPIPEYTEQTGLKVLPLVLELAPVQDTGGQHDSMQLKVSWSEINDAWVAKHQGYAFQWFAMAAAFFIACLALLIRRFSRILD